MSRTLVTLHSRRLADSSDVYHRAQMTVNAFAGGARDGECLQFSLEDEYIQLTRGQVANLANQLHDWLMEKPPISGADPQWIRKEE